MHTAQVQLTPPTGRHCGNTCVFGQDNCPSWVWVKAAHLWRPISRAGDAQVEVAVPEQAPRSQV